MTDTSFAVVGGGIVGASVAYHLAERTDDPVTVYERSDLAAETTDRSTAMIGVAGPDPYYRLKEYGFRLYNEFFAEPTADPRYRQSGRLRVATSTDGARRLERLAAGDPDRTGDSRSGSLDASKYANSLVDYVPGGKLRDRFLLPPLDADLVEGALYRPQYGHVWSEGRTLGPRELALEFVERARAAGASFETDTEVTDVLADGDRVTGIETDGADVVDVDRVVCAAGPWTARLAGMAGVEVPIEHVLSPVFSLELDEPFPSTLPAIKCHESSVGLHPKREDRVLVTYTPRDDEEATPGDDGGTSGGDGGTSGGDGGTPGDAAGRASAIDPSAVGDAASDAHRETALRWAERLVPALADADLVDEWVGVGTRTPDGGPVVGPTAVEGLALAVTPAGIQYAPAVGRVLARQFVDDESTEFDEAVSVSRFDCRAGP